MSHTTPATQFGIWKTDTQKGVPTEIVMSMNYPQRKSPRLQGYDYSEQRAYFVTICTHERVHIFGEVIDHQMRLSDEGHIAEQKFGQVAGYWQGVVEVDCYVVIPNHVHAVIILANHEAVEGKTDATLGQVVNNYKCGVTRLIRQNQPEMLVWQGRYHDHIIRNEPDLNRIREYVAYNPARWAEDVFYG